MKISSAAVVAMLVAMPTLASASNFVVDFEKNWDYSNGDVNDYYNGGLAADGSSGTNLGVSFVNVSGLSNDLNFQYYTGAPSPLGTAYAHAFAPGDMALLNVTSGVGSALLFYYSSPVAVVGALKAYSGLNGTGDLLGTLDLAASGSAYDVWTPVTFNFTGTAKSFDLTGSANVVGFDNISAVPEPASIALLLAGGVVVMRGRRKRAA